MFGIPIELITMLVSTIVSGFFTLSANKTEMMFKAFGAEEKSRRAVRETKNRTFQITRRWIALMSVFSIIVLPKLVAIFYPSVPVSVGYLEVVGGFWGLFTDDSHIVWKEASGLVITPLDTNMVAAIIGLYFGGKVGK